MRVNLQGRDIKGPLDSNKISYFVGPRLNFFIIKLTRCTNSQIYFAMKLYMFRTVRLSIIKSLFTVHSPMVQYMSYGLRAGPGWNCSSILVLLESCLQTRMIYTIAECTVNKLLIMGSATGHD